MSGDTLSKVMFGVWLALFAMWALAFVSGCAAGKPDIFEQTYEIVGDE